jgi:glycerol kinase
VSRPEEVRGMPILAIDQGTSGTKALVVGDDHAVLAAAYEELRPTYLADGGVEQDPRRLLQSVLDAGRAAVEAAGVEVDAVAVANQGETVLAWDRSTGQPLSAAIVWQDRRAADVCDGLRGQSSRIAERTGLTLDPYFSAPKMAWLRRHVTRQGVVTTTDTWLVNALTGAFVTDAATASRSLLLDLDTGRWDDDLVDLFALTGEPLPQIVANDVVVGETTAFGGRLPVGGLIVDQQAALLAQSCFAEGQAKCTYGTGAFLLAQAGRSARRSSGGLVSCIAWQLRDAVHHCFDGQVYTAASAVRWLVDLGLIEAATDLDDVAAAQSDGTICVPAFSGLAAPWWRDDARATFTGMSLATGRAELVLAVLEGIAAQVAELADVMSVDLGSALTTVRVDGGLTRSRRLMQAQADLLQVPVEVYPLADATALGAAALGRLALAADLTPTDAVGRWRPAAVFEPQWSADRAATVRERWRAAAGVAAESGPRRGPDPP